MTRLQTLAIILAMMLAVPAGRALAEWRLDLATDQWVHTPAADVNTDVSDSQFERALGFYLRGDPGQAEQVLKDWLGYYRHTRDSQWALYLLGEARRARGHDYEAYEAYQQLLDGYAGTDLFDRALNAQIDIARIYLDGRKRTMFHMFRVGATDEAEDMLLSVFHRDPRGSHGRAAMAMLADYHFKNGRFAEAETEFEQLADNFPGDPEAAQFRLMAAQASLGRFRGTRYEARPLAETEQRLKEFQNRYPQQAQAEQVDQVLTAIAERRAEKDLSTGDFYRKAGKSKAAIFYYRAVLKDHPGTPWAAQALDRLTALGMEPEPEPTAAPQVTAVHVGGRAQVPGTGQRTGEGVVIGGEDGQVRVLSAGVAPVIRGSTDGPVIDIGTPVHQNEAESPMQNAETPAVAGPGASPSVVKQPESQDHDGS